MAFLRFPGGHWRAQGCSCYISRQGILRLNKLACHRLGVSHAARRVALYFDRETASIGIEVTADGSHLITLNVNGQSLEARRFLQWCGWDGRSGRYPAHIARNGFLFFAVDWRVR